MRDLRRVMSRQKIKHELESTNKKLNDIKDEMKKKEDEWKKEKKELVNYKKT